MISIAELEDVETIWFNEQNNLCILFKFDRDELFSMPFVTEAYCAAQLLLGKYPNAFICSNDFSVCKIKKNEKEYVKLGCIDLFESSAICYYPLPRSGIRLDYVDIEICLN